MLLGFYINLRTVRGSGSFFMSTVSGLHIEGFFVVVFFIFRLVHVQHMSIVSARWLVEHTNQTKILFFFLHMQWISS